MKRGIFAIIGLCFLAGCFTTAPGVSYFETTPYIKPYQQKFDKNLTVVLGEEVKDSFVIESANLKSMEVTEFKKSLKYTFGKTFKASFNDLKFSNSPASEGPTLYIYKFDPTWQKKGATTTVTGNENQTRSRTNYEVASLIRYDAAFYEDGEKIEVKEGEVYSEKTTSKAKAMSKVFKDGVKGFSEHLYKYLVKKLNEK